MSAPEKGHDHPRVLWFSPDKPTDISVGRERIAEELRDAGFEVTLRGTTPRTVLRSLRDRNAYDVVLGTTRAGAFAGAVLGLLGKPFVVDHVDPIRQFEETNSWGLSLAVRLGEDLAFRLADHVLYVYEEERERITRHADAASETDLGVSFERFADPDPDRISVANERFAAAGVGTDQRILIYVGGLEPIYRIDELLAAMERLEDWTLLVLGAGTLEERLERAARRCENVVFLGTVPHEDVPGYLHLADVGVSLVDDSHTLKVLEYAAAGLSVVQARGRARSRFGEYVEFCEPRPEDIARAVRAASEREANGAFREYVREFDYEQVAATYGKVLKGVVSGSEER